MQSKRPTRQQKIFLKSKGLNPDNWLVVSDDRNKLVVVHRQSLKTKTIVREGA